MFTDTGSPRGLSVKQTSITTARNTYGRVQVAQMIHTRQTFVNQLCALNLFD